MIGSSIKSLWPSKLGRVLAAAAPLFFISVARAEISTSETRISSAAESASDSGPQQKYQVQFETQVGYHLVDPRDMAMHRDTLRGEYRLDSSAEAGDNSAWSLVGGFRAYAEGAFGSNPDRYRGPVTTFESEEISLRNLYLQYQGGAFQVRLGNQQVVWGEAFGFYFADIVNPKDLRRYGMGDLEDQRLPTPMLNVKWIVGKYAVQGIYIPVAFFNKIPHLGSDFAFPYDRFLAGANINVNDTNRAPVAGNSGEYGFRATALVSGIDTSVFFLSYLDRMPVYEAQLLSLSPLAVNLNAMHPRLYSMGATATADLGTFVVRAEAFFTKDRQFNTYTNFHLNTEKSDEIVGVLGVDYTQLEKWQLGLQISDDELIPARPGLVASYPGPFLSVHLHGTFWREHALELIVGYYPSDNSTMTRFSYEIPLSDALVFGVGADWLQGNPTSRFGQFQRGSRAFALLKGFFNG
jgi:hypothetical protein